MTSNTQQAIYALGRMAYNMTYRDFRTALGLDDDSYAQSKYVDLKALGRAMAPFSDNTLTRLTEAYRG